MNLLCSLKAVIRCFLVIFGIAVGVSIPQALFNSNCSGKCSFDGFDLVCNCKVSLNESNYQCEDIDTCSLSIGNSINSSINGEKMAIVNRECDCKIKYIDYSLKDKCLISACPEGYSAVNSISCTNIDECSLAIDDYDKNAFCTDTDGSYNCDCYKGFKGNGRTCDNINECLSRKTNRCHHVQNANCQDTVGSYRCECDVNYNWNDYLGCVKMPTEPSKFAPNPCTNCL